MIYDQKKIVFEGRFVQFFVHKFLNGKFLPFFHETPSFLGLKYFFIQIFFKNYSDIKQKTFMNTIQIGTTCYSMIQMIINRKKNYQKNRVKCSAVLNMSQCIKQLKIINPFLFILF